MTDQMLEIKIEQLDKCPICQGDKIPTVYDHTIYSPNTSAATTVHYSICHACGSIFLNPRMTDEFTKHYYQGTYRDILYPETGGISPENCITEKNRAQLQVEICKGYFEGCKTNLEIGCSSGALIKELWDNFKIVSIGIEPDIRYHKLMWMPEIVFSELEKAIGPKFDLITMSHVLEHLNHPLEYIINLVQNYTHVGTLFMVEVPNHDYYQGFGFPHPFSFNIRSLSYIFGKAGCAPVAVFNHGLDGPNPFKYLLAIYKVQTT
jgi:SAM-dependent methyltransferase